MRRSGPDLRRGGPQDSWWTSFRRELGSLVEVHRADRPAANPDARYSRALQRLVDRRRRPGAGRDHAPARRGAAPSDWVGKARRYVAAHRALDEIESGRAARPAPSADRADARKRAWQATRAMRFLHARAQRGFSRALLSIWQTGESSGESEVMTSRWEALGTGLVVLAAAAQVGASAATQHAAPQPPAPPHAIARHARAAAPQYIRDRINELGRGFDGRVGIAVRSIDDGWATGWKADELYPQQSVSKLWVSITALDAVDKGRVRLDDKVTLTRERPDPVPPADRGADPRRRLHDDARRPDVQGDHDQRQYRQRQVDALGRRAGGGARR